jgi:hypothetical protein
MKKKSQFSRLKYVLLLGGLCCCQIASAQLEWRSKGPLYEDPYITVEIEYAMGTDPCDVNATPSRFRYKVTKLKNHREFYINWRFDYFNCEHQLTTRPNSLRIMKTTRLGYITPDNNQFAALRLANNFNDVNKSPKLPEVSTYEPSSAISLEPKVVMGKLAINKGERTTLTLLGGYLAPNTVWKWYENGCNGQAIGSGSSLIVQPLKTTTYALRGDGRSPTPCVLATVTVLDISQEATAIDGLGKICAGEKDVRLTVVGGRLAEGAKWVWYKNECGEGPVGDGYSIYVTPLVTTTYFVRAEGPTGNTLCRSHQLVVADKSVAAAGIDGADRVNYGDSFTLSVRGGYLAPDAKWVWYTGPPDNNLPVGTGNSCIVSSANTTQTYFVRAEGGCYNSDFASQKIAVTKRQTVTLSSSAPRFFINGGVVSNATDQLNNLKNYVTTIGGGKNMGWFVRAKISGDPIKATYESTGLQIINYNMPGYYQYSNKTLNKRAAYTGGIYLGGATMAIYIGAGYGTRELLYSVDRYSYGSSFSSGSAWTKNTTYSYTGAEIEGGLILKVSYFNIMGGVSTIQGKYTDYNLGIGFNL